MPLSTESALSPASTTARSGAGRLITVARTKRDCVNSRGKPSTRPYSTSMKQ